MHNAVEIRSGSASVTIVSLIGDHDLGTYKALKVAFTRAAILTPDVIVDLTSCTFIDSSVIAVLLSTQSLITRDAGRFVLALPDEAPHVARVAELMRFKEILPIYPSLEAALESLTPTVAADPQA